MPLKIEVGYTQEELASKISKIKADQEAGKGLVDGGFGLSQFGGLVGGGWREWLAISSRSRITLVGRG
jgi:hypothetical protein